jgi:general secretion pathway protein G
MKKSKNAFTMIELVFVIVVLGILASIAMPRLAATRTDAEITKGRADVASIRSAIVTERQAQLIMGVTTWIPALSSGTTTLFTGDGTRTLLMYGIAAGAGSGHWSGTDPDYTYKIGTTDVDFTYDDDEGTFTCNTSEEMCKLLVN